METISRGDSMSAAREDKIVKKHMLVVLAAGVALGLAACQSAPASAPTPTPVTQPTAAPVQKASGGPVVVASPEATRGEPEAVRPMPASTPPPVMTGSDLSGDGDKLTRPLAFDSGVIRMLVTHGGSGDFLVQVVAPDGATVPALSARGEYTGAVAFRVSKAGGADLAPGDYQVRVVTTGPWTVSMRQQTWTKGQPPPFTLTRTGSTVLSPIRLDDGAVRMKFTHKGDSAFTARLLHQDGQHALVVGQGTGPYDDERRLTVGTDASADLAPGIYLLAVVANGEWMLSMAP